MADPSGKDSTAASAVAVAAAAAAAAGFHSVRHHVGQAEGKSSSSPAAVTAAAMAAHAQSAAAAAAAGHSGAAGGGGSVVKPQDDKALKMAALSQALNFFDKFRKDQESKGDKTAGHDAAAELDHLASGLQEAASQGAAGAQVRVVWLRIKSRKKTFFSSDGEESNFPLLQLRRRRKRAGAFAKRIIHFFRVPSSRMCICRSPKS